MADLNRTRAFGVAVIIVFTASHTAAIAEEFSPDIRTLVADIRTLQTDVRPVKSDQRPVMSQQAKLDSPKQNIQPKSHVLIRKVTMVDKTIRELNARQTEKEIHVDLSADVLFDFDKWTVKPSAALALKQTALVIANRRKGRVRIYGHTDSKGSVSYNQRLSERRADSVRRWLVENGSFSSHIFDTYGYGELRPVASNVNPDGTDNPEGRAKNRRVEIIIETIAVHSSR